MTDDVYSDTVTGDSYSQVTVEAALLYCGPNDATCNLPKLGIGKYSQDDGVHYRCCTANAIDAGICEQEGRLVVDETIFSGTWFDVTLGNNSTLQNPISTVDQSGVYMVLLANCNSYGIPIWIQGPMRFRSRYGYLPADEWKSSRVSHTLTALGLNAFAWFCRRNNLRKIDIILRFTVLLAFCESLILSLYYVQYNTTGITP